LMREYINSILLENGLEKVRHRLTRLGTPPFEARKLFESDLIPLNLITSFGSDVSEQFLLLNLLPNDLADLYLSGDICLLNLNYWALKPLSIYVTPNLDIDIKQGSTYYDLMKQIFQNLSFLRMLKYYISEDMVIGNFNINYLSILHSLKPKKYRNFLELLILNFFCPYDKSSSQINPFTLQFNFTASENSKQYEENRLNKDLEFYTMINKWKIKHPNLKPPLLLTDQSIFNKTTSNQDLVEKLSLLKAINDNMVYYNSQKSHIINASINRMGNSNSKNNPNRNQLLLDKILINLHSIALKAKQNDDLFFDLLENRLNSVFEFFSIKTKLINNRLKKIHEWNSLISRLNFENSFKMIKESLKSISFFGLSESIKTHCDIELERV
ncbi:MAG: hypothetical protein GF353_19060, partial [Candidatus Lokiarchaeota archaeon]|nr:hypothetical protein [Candidatus Lokiarchaeota archaeon]